MQGGQDAWGWVREGQRGLQGLDAAGLCGLWEGVGTSSCSDGETWKIFSRGRTWLALLPAKVHLAAA